MVELTPSEKRNLIEALRDDYSVRQISETLGFNRNFLYYQPKIDPSEEVRLNEYEDITEAKARIGHFITQVYHQKRPHSALGYLTPVEFQRKNLS